MKDEWKTQLPKGKREVRGGHDQGIIRGARFREVKVSMDRVGRLNLRAVLGKGG